MRLLFTHHITELSTQETEFSSVCGPQPVLHPGCAKEVDEALFDGISTLSYI